MSTVSDRLIVRLLDVTDLTRLVDIDRSEEVTLGYRVEDGELVSEAVQWQRQPWDDEMLRRYRLRSRSHMEQGGQGVGVFDGERLVGFATLGCCFRGPQQDYLHLDLLYVSRPYRRMGVATRLMNEIERLARERGARRLYISATPSQSAVGFYFSRGAHLAETPDPELHAMEPHDIPLMLEL